MGEFKVKGGIMGGSPFPMVETDFQRNLTSVTDLLKKFDEMRKERYDRGLLSDMLSNLNKPEDDTDLEKIIAQVGKMDDTTANADPTKTIDQNELMNVITQATQRKSMIPERMSERLAGGGGVEGGFLKRAGNVFNPFGTYTGGMTDLERSLANMQLQRGQEDPLERMSKRTMLVKNLVDTFGQRQKTETEPANLYDTLDLANAEANRLRTSTGTDYVAKWNAKTGKYYLEATQPDIAEKVIRGQEAKDKANIISWKNLAIHKEYNDAEKASKQAYFDRYNEVARLDGLPQLVWEKTLGGFGGYGSKWFMKEETQPTGLTETPATDTGTAGLQTGTDRLTGRKVIKLANGTIIFADTGEVVP